jgi:hypothetical protein
MYCDPPVFKYIECNLIFRMFSCTVSLPEEISTGHPVFWRCLGTLISLIVVNKHFFRCRDETSVLTYILVYMYRAYSSLRQYSGRINKLACRLLNRETGCYLIWYYCKNVFVIRPVTSRTKYRRGQYHGCQECW